MGSGTDNGQRDLAETNGLEVAELGPLILTAKGGEQSIRGDRAKLALALLIIDAKAGASVDAMVDAMWPGPERPATARQSLSNIIGRLRAALGQDSITTGEGRYRLADHIGSQRQRFLDAITEVESLIDDERWSDAIDRADAALALWRGQPWGGIDDAEAVAEDRRFLEMRQARLVSLRTRGLLAAQRWAEATEAARWLVDADPWNEANHVGLIEALAADGRRTEAMRAADQARATLAEAGMTPGTDLLEIERRLLDAEPPARGATGSGSQPASVEAQAGGSHETVASLPRYRDDFVGREAEGQLLSQLLAEARLVTLVGPGGVGKTRLAVDGAAPDLFDQVRFVDLTVGDDPSRLPAMLAEAVGVAPGSTESVADDLARRFPGERVLVIVDNCEHLIEAAGSLVGTILDRCPTVTVLATSREGLELPGERVLPVAPLPIGGGDEPGAAVQLLDTRARAADPAIDLLQERSTAERICRLVDGLPLAIELAAGRLRALTPSELADRLDGRLSLLGARRGRAERHRTLESVVEWSYDLLEPMEQLAFERLSIFVGGFTAEAAEAVIADEVIPASRVLDLVVRLTEQSLLVADRNEEQGQRFRQLETLRAFALSRHGRRDERRRIAERHLAWSLDQVEILERAMRTPDQDAALAAIVADHDNFRAARQLALAEGRQLDALRVTASVPLDDSGSRSATLAHLLAGIDDAPTAHVAHATYALASAQFERGHFGDAADNAAGAAALYRTLGERRQEAYAQMIEAMGRWGDDDKRAVVERLLEEGMASFTLLGDEMGQGYIAFVWATWIVAGDGDLTKAAQLAQRSCDLFERVESPFGLAHGEEALAQVASADGDDDLALTNAVAAVERLHRHGNVSCLAHTIDTVAMVKARTGEHAGAATLLGVADRLRQEAGTATKPWEAYAATVTSPILAADATGLAVDALRLAGRDVPLRQILAELHAGTDAARA